MEQDEAAFGKFSGGALVGDDFVEYCGKILVKGLGEFKEIDG